MNDLPKTDPSDMPVVPAGGSLSGSKEVVGGGDHAEGLIDVTGQELELPREVVSAGVRVQPTHIPIPPPVAQMGVVSAGNNVSVSSPPQVQLPLTDDEIAKGLHMSIINSVRWLAEWCVKRLKQLHKAITGKETVNVRVKV